MCDGSVRIIGSSPFFNYHKGRKKQGGASVMADTEKIIRKKYDVPIWHKITTTSDGKYKIQNRWSGLYLGVLNNSTNDGASIVQVADELSSSEWFILLTD